MRGEKNHSFFVGSSNRPQNETHDEFNYHQKDNVLFFVASGPFGNLIFGRDAFSGVRLIEMVEATRDGRDRKNALGNLLDTLLARGDQLCLILSLRSSRGLSISNRHRLFGIFLDYGVPTWMILHFCAIEIFRLYR